MSAVTTPPVQRGPSPPLEKQTTVGNYCVANCPPHSFWKPEFAPQTLAALERPPWRMGKS